MIPLVLILIPLVGGLFLLLSGKIGNKAMAVGFSAINALVTIAAAYFYYTDLHLGAFNQIVNLVGTKFLFSLNEFGNQGGNLSLAMVLLTNILYPIILLTSSKNIKNESSFYGLLLLIQSGLVGVFTAWDVISFYIFFEMGLVPAYFLVGIWGSGADRAKTAFKFFVYTLFGSLIMLVAIIYLVNAGGMGFHTDYGSIFNTARSLDLKTQLELACFFLLAFMIKMPMVPFHTWQPKTYRTAPTTVTMVLSALMAKMGLYGIIRFVMTAFPAAYHHLQPYMMVLAVIGIIYAAVIAIRQDDLKSLLAYSSISHMALMAAGIFAFNLSGFEASVLQMFNHGIIVVGLLFALEIIYQQTGTYKISELGGIAKNAPRLATCFLIMLLASVGLPLTNGFVGEFLLLKGIFQAEVRYSHVLAMFAGVTIILGAVYMLRSYQYSMYGEANQLTSQTKDISITQLLIWVPLILIVLALGIFPNLFLNLIF